MTDAQIHPFPSTAKPRLISAGWLSGPDPADTLPTARALSQAVESFSLNSAGVRAHTSVVAMMTDPELNDKHSRLALGFIEAAEADLAVMRGLLSNHEPEAA